MKLSTWRPRLLQFISSNITYSQLLTDVPFEVAQPGLFLPPLRGLSSEYKSSGIRSTAIQDIYIAERFPDVSYWQLPIAEMEGKHQSFTVRFLEGFRSKDRGISVVNADASNRLIETPISIQEANETGEWLVFFYWCFTVEFLAEDETPLPLFLPGEVSVDLHRASLIDFTDTVLDTVILERKEDV